ncbi:MAG: ribonuclease R, partial [Oscillospiraceae bacterium]|nr:ribonuclease R [Oscillospiraceae bacterium]
MDINKKIYTVLERGGVKGVTKSVLKRSIKLKKGELPRILSESVYCGKIALKDGIYYSLRKTGLIPAKIIKAKTTSAVASSSADGGQFFIHGRNLNGAMLGDSVMLSVFDADKRKQPNHNNRKKTYTRQHTPAGGNNRKTAKVFSIFREGPSIFTGIFDYADYKGHISYNRQAAAPAVVSSSISTHPVFLEKSPVNSSALSNRRITPGDLVIAKVTSRGSRHYEHKCEITEILGASGTASSMAEALIRLEGIPVKFHTKILEHCEMLRKNPPDPGERIDFRNEIIFTIDGEDAKDLDDAVSLTKENGLYKLGVHIADVSHYVKFLSATDKEAFLRGTSVYFPGGVIPMLPQVLSEDLCSLNPGEDKLTFSALITLDENGNTVDYKFCKTVINSKLRGIYNEVNSILDGTADRKIVNKYAETVKVLHEMKNLSDILKRRKIQRGVPRIESDEPYFTLDEKGCAVSVKSRAMGESENIIEEFMLTANECAAKFAKDNGFAFIFRVHEPPLP